jgi:hypothetical protein
MTWMVAATANDGDGNWETNKKGMGGWTDKEMDQQWNERAMERKVVWGKDGRKGVIVEVIESKTTMCEGAASQRHDFFTAHHPMQYDVNAEGGGGQTKVGRWKKRKEGRKNKRVEP